MVPVKTNQNWLPSIFNDFFDNEWMARANATAPAINAVKIVQNALVFQRRLNTKPSTPKKQPSASRISHSFVAGLKLLRNARKNIRVRPSSRSSAIFNVQ